ncbi:hypothetical protein LZ30DRAFT_726797 [Colletotrichum cereale]|nr:hypothetical protein LZ30DRAFT_726797 [Colletotrichum cereale]
MGPTARVCRYVNMANFLSNVENFKIDARPVSPCSYMSGIHRPVSCSSDVAREHWLGDNQQVSSRRHSRT